MKAMVLKGTEDLRRNTTPLVPADMREPAPAPGEVLVKVSACGVCHTELDEIEGRTPPPVYPVVPGHQIVGRVAALGKGASRFQVGDRVGIGWIYWACGHCSACLAGNENLCGQFRATGRDTDGGFAELMTVSEKFAYAIPDIFSDAEAAPLLCAGAIGYRSLRLTGLRDGQPLGLTGFGASGHLALKMAGYLYPKSQVYVFARHERERTFALELGAAWSGKTEDRAPVELRAIIDTTPAWKPVVEALGSLEAGGRLVVNAIRKEEKDKDCLLSLDYPAHLWMEKEIKSVANVTRRDIEEFLKLAAEIPIRPEVEEFPLKDANRALAQLKAAKIRGAKVLRIA